MPKRNEAVKITQDTYKTGEFDILQETGTKKVVLKDILNINNGNIEINSSTEKVEEYKLWVEMSNEPIETYINTILGDYKSRTKLIDAIVTKLIDNNINGISINFKEIESNNMIRFIIEFAPKLREIGITTCVVLNEGMNKQDYINIVDYIVE